MTRVIVITSPDWQRLRDALLTPDGCENAGVLYCAPSSGKSANKLLVRRFVPVPPQLYIERNSYHLEVSPTFYNDVVTDCLRQNLTPVIVHSHPHHGETHYSQSDDYGEARLLPTLNSLLPGRHAASLVITYDSATGRDFSNDEFHALEGLFVVGANSFKKYFRATNVRPEDEQTERFDRQIRAFGREGQQTLADLRVAVVGIGGIGSLVAEQLVRAGIQQILLIDDDRIESSNVSRLFGSQQNDIGQWKAHVVAKYLSTLTHTSVEASCESAIRQSVLLSLRDCDLVFACVDNDRTRALLNRLAHQYLVPVIDHGTRLDGRDGKITAAAGRVSILGPGLSCLRCSHHLNPERIRAESMSRAERTRLAKEGYIMGIDEPAPAVVSINTVVAGLGVTAGINMFVNLTGRSQPVDQIYDASSGAVFPITPIHQRGCDICDDLDGVKALGDLQIVSAYE